MSLEFGGISAVAYHADNDRALAMFATALKIASARSTAVAQLLESANRALAVGETQLDTVRLDGLRATDDDVEVRRDIHSIGTPGCALLQADVQLDVEWCSW